MKNAIDSITGLVILSSWIMGVVIASGFVSTTFAIIFPFWAFYLTVEHFMILFNII